MLKSGPVTEQFRVSQWQGEWEEGTADGYCTHWTETRNNNKIDRGDTHVAWIQFEKVKLRPAMSEPAQAGMLKRRGGVETPSSTGRGTTGIGSGARSTDEIEFSGQSDECR